MYLLKNMSNLHLFMSSNTSINPIQLETTLEKIKEEEEEEEENMEARKQQEEKCSVSVSPSSTSSSSSFHEEVVVVSSKIEGEKHGLEVVDDDDGYHTPTSPRCKIPVASKCPPAPKKIPSLCRNKKRKAFFCIELEDVELQFSERGKKARDEVNIVIDK